MATDADIVPGAVTDFVFDLYDSVTLSQLTEEQSRLYNDVFTDLSSKVCNCNEWMNESLPVFPNKIIPSKCNF